MPIAISLIQSQFIAGNIDANVARITLLYRMAVIAKADLVLFPEMAVSGYAAQDLLLSPAFQESVAVAVAQCAALTAGGPAMLVGAPWQDGGQLYNSALLLADGEVQARRDKHHLPNDGVFDERRYFTPGPLPEPIAWRGLALGVMVCEDMWWPSVAAHLRARGAELLVVLNASPFEAGKQGRREALAAQRVGETGLPLIYVNQVGAQDELVYDGGSFVLAADGAVCARLAAFGEDIEPLRLQGEGAARVPAPGTVVAPLDQTAQRYHAMTVGLREFVQRNGYAGVLLGMSGGIDSALAAALATDALGADRVRCLMLSSPVTSAASIADAADCAGRLGIAHAVVPIGQGMDAFAAMLAGAGAGEAPPSPLAVGENQTRLRAGVLLALSRQHNLLLLNTGNKSELAVGFTTPHGDLCGHFAVLKDLYKTEVYAAARWRNGHGDVIPQRILDKPPSAELYPGQTDQDTLPPYAELDAMLRQLLEHGQDIDAVAARGFPRALVRQVADWIDAAEYKRHQAPPGVKLGPMSFRHDRRYPITNGWHVMRQARPDGAA